MTAFCWKESHVIVVFSVYMMKNLLINLELKIIRSVLLIDTYTVCKQKGKLRGTGRVPTRTGKPKKNGKSEKSQFCQSGKVGTMTRESTQMALSYSITFCCKEIGMSMIIVIFLVGVMKDIILSPELRILRNVSQTEIDEICDPTFRQKDEAGTRA